MSHLADAPTPRVLVITVSDRAAHGAREDRSGPRLVELLTEAGYDTMGPRVVTDGVEPVTEGLRAGIDEGFGVIVTTGGTGVSPRDFTPEATSSLVTRELHGVAEHLRREGTRHTPLAVLSRGVIGVADATEEGAVGTLLVNLPGSVKGVEQSTQALLPLLPHLLSQIVGFDH
ncbi:MogA/MoaB family molybdenum cofactor biosynthesis protein [Ornithinimicrobium cryptoxanthini]|uniref:MogA/MoaB family molybdenum cofactor biosynthesis protein n=1 Tax=Ornithinimicrobium cryptoxanthini TaxID=2934161 RepID=A0ABY4YI06_9MICO|nr:MogA/MoaB family molybdenum cofactor biosynthesis protein [Ornithinimicrobium cryptoxanthini]USQ76234.1 MogA/MoaB family molybdenum cofactor biosynthesis protein [Ornithinimicrobium cryptoxanthini]